MRPALQDLWAAGPAWANPLSKALAWREFNAQVRLLLPLHLLIAGLVGGTLLMGLAPLVGDAKSQAIASLWRSWALLLSPVVSGLAIAIRCAPQRAVQLSTAQATAEYRTVAALGFAPATVLAWPWMLAHAALSWTINYLACGASLVCGLVLSWTLSWSTPLELMDIVLTAISPHGYVVSGLLAAAIGWISSFAALGSVWPPRAQREGDEVDGQILRRATRVATTVALVVAAAMATAALEMPDLTP